MAVRTWVGRFCVAEGRVQEDGPWLGSLIRQRPDDDADELYVLVEPASTHSDEYTSQLVDVIAQLYAKDPLSLTGALTRSLRAAHDHLRDWNRKSLKEHRVGAGASCLALRAREAYLAQIGPSIAYIRTAEGQCRRLEPESPTFDASLGMADDFAPRLTRVELNPGDLVLLASTNVETVAPRDHIERTLSHGADDALQELYLLCRDVPDASIVLLSCFEQEIEPPQYLTRAGDATLLDPTSMDGAPTAPEPVLAGGGAPPLEAKAELAFDAGVPAPPQPAISEQVREIAATTAPPSRANVRIRGDASTPRRKSASSGGVLPPVRVPKLAIFAALAVALVGVLVWWQLPDSVAESREEKFVALMAEAREASATAQSTSDAGLKRQLLTEAEATLVEAEKIHDDNGELLALKADVAAAIGVLDAVYEVREFAPIADLAQQVTGTLSITSTVVGGGNAYLLDAGDGRVLRVPLAPASALTGGGAPETILEQGQAGFVVPSRPASIAWADQTGSLIIVDDNRQAFSYVPGGPLVPILVREAADLASLDAIATSGENLYVLDVAANQVWRYLPGQSGFDSERTDLVDAESLADATELAVAQDIYVLDRELGIRRFQGRAEVPFPLAGIDRPLMEPAALTVLPGSNRLVVTDRGNKRIVIASPEGAFLRQIVSPAFTDLRAAAVDEGTGTLYVLNGDTLLQATFPP
jgi:hypothetical protein